MRRKVIKKVSENVLLPYFSLKGKVIQSPSLWSLNPMLKSTLRVKIAVPNYLLLCYLVNKILSVILRTSFGGCKKNYGYISSI